MSHNTLRSLIKKEVLHILRDPRTSLITLMMPLVLLLLFGFAISMEIRNIKIVAVLENHDEKTRESLQKIMANEYFTFMGIVKPDDPEKLLKNGDIDAVIWLKGNGGDEERQIIVDASNPTIAQSTVAYIEGTLSQNETPLIIVHTLYNPRLKSSYNFVPGIMGMIFILVCGIMTSVSIVGEKESGTMNLLLVSPVKPYQIILGKLIPYFFLSCIILAIMLAIAYGVLELPLSAGIFNVIVLTLIYIMLSLSIGLFVSSLVENQIAALIISAMGFMIPVIFLSGMIFPIDNMPVLLQWLSCIIPARWYISGLRKLMIQQVPMTLIRTELLILSGMCLLIFGIAVRKFNSK